MSFLTVGDPEEVSKTVFSQPCVSKAVYEALKGYPSRLCFGERVNGTGPYKWMTYSEVFEYPSPLPRLSLFAHLTYEMPYMLSFQSRIQVYKSITLTMFASCVSGSRWALGKAYGRSWEKATRRLSLSQSVPQVRPIGTLSLYLHSANSAFLSFVLCLVTLFVSPISFYARLYLSVVLHCSQQICDSLLLLLRLRHSLHSTSWFA